MKVNRGAISNLVYIFLVLGVIALIGPYFIPDKVDENELSNSEIIIELFNKLPTSIPGDTVYLTDTDNISIIGREFIDSTNIDYIYFTVDDLQVIELSNDSVDKPFYISVKSDGTFCSDQDMTFTMNLIKSFFRQIKITYMINYAVKYSPIILASLTLIWVLMFIQYSRNQKEVKK